MFIDRIFGLLGLFFIFLISGIFFVLERQKLFQQFLYFLIFCCIFLLLLVGILFFPIHWKDNFKKYIPSFLRQKSLIIWKFISILQTNKKKLFISFLLSVGIHFIVLLLIYQISIILFVTNLSFWEQALIIPIGLVVTALPIAPSGVGIGHVAFDNLYQLFQFSGGATIFNIFIISQILVFLTGVFPFLFYKKPLIKK